MPDARVPSASAAPQSSNTLTVVHRPLSRLAQTAAVLALLCVLAAIAAGLGSRFGLWHFRTGFNLLRYAAYGAIAVGILSLVAVFLTRPGGRRRGLPLALAGLLVSLLFVGYALSWQQKVASVPRIHDITTDTRNPPQFVDVLPLRANADNPATYEGAEVATQQAQAYPDIQPVLLDMPANEAFSLALATAREMKWDIVAADEATGRIEATDQTFWFGFKDDVVIRLTPAQGRTVLDIRSVSRVGRSDVGKNAERIREYVERVRG